MVSEQAGIGLSTRKQERTISSPPFRAPKLNQLLIAANLGAI